MADPPTVAEIGRTEESYRVRELELREREIVAREHEVTAREKEVRMSRWLNPLVIALFVAAFGLAGNGVVAFYNNRSSEKVERLRSQSSLVLEAIRTSPEKACKNLMVFINLGLLDDPEKTIRQACNPESNAAPSLPSITTFTTSIIQGTVLDADTGKPIPKVNVHSSFMGISDVTDDSGHFSIPRNTLFMVQLSFEKEGYSALSVQAPLSDDALTLRMQKAH
jgi:carboxypeptidase-like protein